MFLCWRSTISLVPSVVLDHSVVRAPLPPSVPHTPWPEPCVIPAALGQGMELLVMLRAHFGLGCQ